MNFEELQANLKVLFKRKPMPKPQWHWAVWYTLVGVIPLSAIELIRRVYLHNKALQVEAVLSIENRMNALVLSSPESGLTDAYILMARHMPSWTPAIGILHNRYYKEILHERRSMVERVERVEQIAEEVETLTERERERNARLWSLLNAKQEEKQTF